MLDSDSSKQVYDPTMGAKTDSVYYAYGVLQTMQQLADQYYFQNELRGDLVTTNSNATTHLRDLANYAAGAENKYDSIYLYYQVINNCNYYLAHRDTLLRTGATYVTRAEYVAIAAIRAWTYLQLGRQYGSVPYITEPVTTIQQINNLTSETDYNTIFRNEIANLENLKARFGDYLQVPTFDRGDVDMGSTSWSGSKYFTPKKCFIPLDIVLGDLYLETNQYTQAINCYLNYLKGAVLVKKEGSNTLLANLPISINYVDEQRMNTTRQYNPALKQVDQWPDDYSSTKTAKIYVGASDWQSSYSPFNSEPGDVISYIPMGVNYTKGQITDVPKAFGYNYYATERDNSIRVANGKQSAPLDSISILPSAAYIDSAAHTKFYYYTPQALQVAPYNDIVKSFNGGDARATIISTPVTDPQKVYVYKPTTGYIYLYRNTTVWLHLAEALNRAGYPDAAFAVLKNGIQKDLQDFRYVDNGGVEDKIDDKYYITPETWEYLSSTFLSEGNLAYFTNPATRTLVGIHYKGCGAVEYLYSPYKYNTVVGGMITALNDRYGLGKSLAVDLHSDQYSDDAAVRQNAKNLAILAVEELLCDEYAMEFAFEGTRYSDLRRIAIHRNADTNFGAGFGDKWMQSKLAAKGVAINTTNCYLPKK